MKKMAYKFITYKMLQCICEIINIILFNLFIVFGIAIPYGNYDHFAIGIFLIFMYMPALIIIALIYFIFIKNKYIKTNHFYVLIITLVIFYILQTLIQFLEVKLCMVNIMPQYCKKMPIFSLNDENTRYYYNLQGYWCIYWFMALLMLSISYYFNTLKLTRRKNA
jgi:hypothetical protein